MKRNALCGFCLTVRNESELSFAGECVLAASCAVRAYERGLLLQEEARALCDAVLAYRRGEGKRLLQAEREARRARLRAIEGGAS